MGTIPFEKKKQYKDGINVSLYVYRTPFLTRLIHGWYTTVSYSAVIFKAIYLEMM